MWKFLADVLSLLNENSTWHNRQQGYILNNNNVNINNKSTFKFQTYIKAHITYGNEAYLIKHKATFLLTLLSESDMKTPTDWRECFESVPTGRFEVPSLGTPFLSTKLLLSYGGIPITEGSSWRWLMILPNLSRIFSTFFDFIPGS